MIAPAFLIIVDNICFYNRHDVLYEIDHGAGVSTEHVVYASFYVGVNSLEDGGVRSRVYADDGVCADLQMVCDDYHLGDMNYSYSGHGYCGIYKRANIYHAHCIDGVVHHV